MRAVGEARPWHGGETIEHPGIGNQPGRAAGCGVPHRDVQRAWRGQRDFFKPDHLRRQDGVGDEADEEGEERTHAEGSDG